MPDLEVTISVDPSTGKARVVGGGSGGRRGGSGGGSGSSGGGSDDMAQSIARAMRESGAGAGGPGGHQMPWWLGGGLLGSAAAQSVQAALDPHMSGAQQQSIMATQAARAGSYTAARASLAPASALGRMAGVTDEGDANRLAEAIANAVGAAVEKSMQMRTQTQAAATSSVQGFASRYAAAGAGGQLSDADLMDLLDRETSRQERIYEMRARVADLSGNAIGGDVVAGQRAIGQGLDSALSGLGLSIPRNRQEELRRQMEQQYRNNLATDGQRQ